MKSTKKPTAAAAAKGKPSDAGGKAAAGKPAAGKGQKPAAKKK